MSRQIIASITEFVFTKQLLPQSAVEAKLEQCWATGSLMSEYRKQITKVRWTVRSGWFAPIYLMLHLTISISRKHRIPVGNLANILYQLPTCLLKELHAGLICGNLDPECDYVVFPH